MLKPCWIPQPRALLRSNQTLPTAIDPEMTEEKAIVAATAAGTVIETLTAAVVIGEMAARLEAAEERQT
jgi:hypothetical protein